MSRWILQFIGAGVNLTIANHVVGDELGEANRCVGIERKSFIQTNRDVLGISTVSRSGGEH